MTLDFIVAHDISKRCCVTNNMSDNTYSFLSVHIVTHNYILYT